jgi:phosphopantothenoylcysteine decarboxylase/phosphopantothenate--cysteine ligase
MAQPDRIAAAIRQILSPVGPLSGRRVLVTAGGTREPLDPVRFLGNRSSGRMGVALADEALVRGAEVTTLLCNAVVRPRGGLVIETPTTADLERETLARAADADVVLMAAAVADYRPASVEPEKRGRDAAWTLSLVPTADILATVGAHRRPGQVLVGFAAETDDGLERARRKRERKGVDLIVCNDVSRSDIGFEVDANEVTIVAADGEQLVARASKQVIAGAILDAVERRL